jgi:CRISPR-associated protein Cmr4
MEPEVYIIRVLTPTHVGAGSGLGHIDLPIYREAHTGYPAIPATAIKGVLRTKAILELASEKSASPKDIEEAIESEEEKKGLPDDVMKEVKRLREAFGSRNSEGKLIFTDARILFFPVRSLKGIFALITCPYVIKRFYEDVQKNGLPRIDLSEKECIPLGHKNITRFGDKEVVVLEEFSFEVKKTDIPHIPTPEGVDKERVVLVHDDVFKHMVESYTEIQTHIKVDLKKGTVEDGALWTEEYLPTESVLYFMVFRNKSDFQIERGVYQIGGNSSTGKGIVEVRKYENP